MQTRAPADTETTTFERTYPGSPEHIRRVRADVAALLSDCPVADDLILAVSELASNAAIHSCSHEQGGQFSVRVSIRADDYAWAEVEDQGGTWRRRGHDDRPHGLDIVAALAGDGNWGIDGDEHTGRSVWVRLDWKGHP